MRIKELFFFAFIGLSQSAFATTWDEPWQDKVIKDADYFVFAKIRSYNDKRVKIEIIKSLGGKNLEGKLNISRFHLLMLCSYSSRGHEVRFNFRGLKKGYFFIKKDSLGNYCIATPSTGFDYLENGEVHATYRHSYHRALVAVEVYEKTMTAIFNHYRQQAYDTTYVKEYINKQLALLPASLKTKEASTFFLQHVALECIYHLRFNGYYSRILPFLRDSANFHNQVSAARALTATPTEECKQEPMSFIADGSKDQFVQVICIWTLAEFHPGELKPQLLKIKETAGTKYTGFGGSIMDPRVCTHFPTVAQAIEQLTETL